MEIGPVTAVRIAPRMKPIEAELGLTDVIEIEHSSRTGDETYSPSGVKASTGFEDDEDTFEDLEDDPDAPPPVKAVASVQISYFA
ncbi:MAG: hypothetical protein ABSG00_02810 [Terracidiphilus sp.]